MCEAVRIWTRYYTPGPSGETRAERHERFNKDVPEFDIPDAGQYLWDWYFEISKLTVRVVDGQALPLTWDNLEGWARIVGKPVSADEFAILRAMDTAYCEALTGELDYARSKAGKASNGRYS